MISRPEILLYGIKLILGGIAAFLAIMLWSKTRDLAWVSLVAGVVTAYAGIVYDMLSALGIAYGVSSSVGRRVLAGIPLSALLFTILPFVFYITAFILMLRRKF